MYWKAQQRQEKLQTALKTYFDKVSIIKGFNNILNFCEFYKNPHKSYDAQQTGKLQIDNSEDIISIGDDIKLEFDQKSQLAPVGLRETQNLEKIQEIGENKKCEKKQTKEMANLKIGDIIYLEFKSEINQRKVNCIILGDGIASNKLYLQEKESRSFKKSLFEVQIGKSYHFQEKMQNYKEKQSHDQEELEQTLKKNNKDQKDQKEKNQMKENSKELKEKRAQSLFQVLINKTR